MSINWFCSWKNRRYKKGNVGLRRLTDREGGLTAPTLHPHVVENFKNQISSYHD